MTYMSECLPTLADGSFVYLPCSRRVVRDQSVACLVESCAFQFFLCPDPGRQLGAFG